MPQAYCTTSLLQAGDLPNKLPLHWNKLSSAESFCPLHIANADTNGNLLHLPRHTNESICLPRTFPYLL